MMQTGRQLGLGPKLLYQRFHHLELTGSLSKERRDLDLASGRKVVRLLAELERYYC